MGERAWMLPSVLLTVLLGGTALLLMPNHSGVLPALTLLPVWLMISAVLAAVHAWFRMIASGVRSPFSHIVHTLRHDWRRVLTFGAGIAIAGLNMCAFMWTKPLLNYYVAFWADPYLAHLDRLLFLGHDPWTLLTWLNSFATAVLYHRAWFAMMIVTLLIVLTQPSSPRKSAVMMTYFLLWSVVGPVIHILLPAAGPIFYARLGYDDRFAGIQVPPEMTEMSDYLWRVYQTDHFGPSSGISAMPSLHIATMAWMVLAIYVLARKWTWALAIPGMLIFLLSISLGWHYAADGIVGASATIGCYRLCLRAYERPRFDPAGALEPKTA